MLLFLLGSNQNLFHLKLGVLNVKRCKSLKYLNKLRNKLSSILGNKANNLNAEGNFYFEENSGIGFHGDAERKIVICLSLGDSSVLRYCWRMPGTSDHYGENIDVKVNNGDKNKRPIA